MEEPFGRREAGQRGGLRGAPGTAEDQHPGGVATEIADVVPDPFERLDDVEHPGVTRTAVLLSGCIFEVEKPEDAEPVIDGHHDGIAVGGQRCPVVHRPRTRAAGEGAAVHPDHHWPGHLPLEACSPDIEYQAVLALRRLVTGQAAEEPGELGHPGGRFRVGRRAPAHLGHTPLGGRRAVLAGVAHSGPRRHRSRRLEAVRAPGGVAVRDALEGMDAAGRDALHFATGRVDHRSGHRLPPFSWTDLAPTITLAWARFGIRRVSAWTSPSRCECTRAVTKYSPGRWNMWLVSR